MADLTVNQVAKKMGIPATKLRYYIKQGLFPFIETADNGYHIFKDSDLGWVHFALMLRETGMALADVKHYENLTLEGVVSVPERIEILTKQQETLDAKQQKIQQQQDLINVKISRYRDVLAGKTVDKWTPEYYHFEIGEGNES